MGDDRDQVRARLIDRPKRLELSLRLTLEPVALDNPRQQSGERLEESHVLAGEAPPPLRLDVEHAHDLVVPDQGHAAHRCELVLVDAADPVEALVGVDIERCLGLARLGHDARDAHAQRQPRHADLLGIEAVRGGQRDAQAVAIEQIQRAHLGLRRSRRAVDDRAHELVPRAGRANKARDLGQELELGQAPRAAVGTAPRTLDSSRHGGTIASPSIRRLQTR